MRYSPSRQPEIPDIRLERVRAKFYVLRTRRSSSVSRMSEDEKLQIWMVAGFADVAERKQLLVAGVRFKLTTFGL
jgi:hypothetical protein